MQGTAIIPQKQIVRAPDVLVDELRLLLMFEQRVENFLALLFRQSLDRNGHQAIDIERLLAGCRMGPDNRMPAGRYAFAQSCAAMSSGGLVIVGVERLAPLDLFLDRVGKRFVGLVGIGKE